MKPLKKSLLTLATIAMCLAASAAPAKPGFRTVTQPDGTTLRVQTIGNHNLHFSLTDDDILVARNADGVYCYATINDEGAIVPTEVKAHSAETRPAAEYAQTVDINDVDISALRTLRDSKRQNSARRSSSVSGLGCFTSNFPKTGDIHGLVILVNFTDLQFKGSDVYPTTAKDYFTNMLSQDGFSELNGCGSSKEYFEKMSGGLFRPTFDVVGPYTVSQNYAYYGENDTRGDDKNATEMIEEACKLADADVNFADYDNDGDGVCDYVYVFYAGYSEAMDAGDDYIWPFSFNLSWGKDKLILDGVVIDSFACSAEYGESGPDGIGTFTHEFSHVLGLPDLYDTNNELICTPGDYDILDVGCYNNNSRTPPAYSAYERNAMGWIDLKELTEPADISLGHIEETNEAYIIRTTNDNEFYLLENRQLSGWDSSIPNHGMLIWHIDFDQEVWDHETINNDKSHQYVDIVEACNSSRNTNKANEKAWVYPGTSTTKRTSFTSTTKPAMVDWSGNAIDMPITDITEADGIISFKVKGGAENSVNALVTNANNTPKEYYNLMGEHVLTTNDDSSASAILSPGVYIVRNGTTTTKLLIK